MGLALFVLIAEHKELPDVLVLEGPALLGVLQDLVRQELLEDLAVVDLLLNCAARHQAVHHHLVLLADPPRPLLGLEVRRGIPVRVVQDHPIRAGEVEAQAAHPRGQAKQLDLLRLVELVHQLLPLANRGGTVHPEVSVSEAQHRPLDDVQHLARLGEHQDLVALGAPLFENLDKDGELARPARGAELPVGGGPVRAQVQQVRVVADLLHGVDAGEGVDLAIHDRLAVVGAQVVPVQVQLIVTKQAEQHVLRLLGQVHVDIHLPPPKQVGADQVP
mmetsp:Transcript_4647/g.16681  ORF Transcript_4647/g.16681 Transcript_4647/m.16681 type:complete len:275 (-) Transcript_4647:1648-2472(-)